MFHPPDDYKDVKNSIYIIPLHARRSFYCYADVTVGWEHVMVTAIDPRDGSQSISTWDEMCLIKDIFWDEEDMVMQLHPAKEEYVNDSPYTLHLWRPQREKIPSPFLGLLQKWANR